MSQESKTVYQNRTSNENFIEPFIIANIGTLLVVVKAGALELKLHDNAGKHIHSPTFDMTSCRRGHELVVQSVVKQATKLRFIYYDVRTSVSLLEIQCIKFIRVVNGFRKKCSCSLKVFESFTCV
ncbi:unnamed protein product [Rotaria socialis]|uniref:Uncharacterized protein n=1 Tax=Rotaria socialis TaxID=392032 RepID=A0A820YPH5_9BILA|nr:unnamed protein product [Rotaria socialis]CAF3549170.1 unnamed protein product [Rotaria socialis]CAF4550795.1 unnamed protein product [Rotaria socialis]CAF4672850.1 unnamed protein product [Rotaria socialis]